MIDYKYLKFYALAFVLLISAILGCTDDGNEFKVNEETLIQWIDISDTNLSLKVGKSDTLTAYAKDSNGEILGKVEITWKSSRPDHVQIENGVITALSEGTSRITAMAGEKDSDPCDVSVFAVNQVILDRYFYSMVVGDTLIINSTATDSSGKIVHEVDWQWENTNPQIAQVDNGAITPLSQGITEVTAVGDGVSSLPCTIQVINDEYFPIWTGEHTGYVKGVRFTPDGNKILSGSWDYTLKAWDSSNGDLLWTASHDGYVNDIDISQDGSKVASGSYDKTIKLWDTTEGSLLWTSRFQSYEGPIENIALAPDANRVFCSTNSLYWGVSRGVLKMWDILNDNMSWSEWEYEIPNAVAYSNDGTMVCWGQENGYLRVKYSETGNHVFSGMHSAEVTAVVFSDDDSKLASGSMEINVYDVETEALLWQGYHQGFINCIAWSPDGSRVASVSEDKTLKMWDANTGALLWENMHNGIIYCVAISPDGSIVATGGQDNRITLWNAQDGSPIAVGKHGGHIYSIDFSPDGNSLVSGSKTKTVKVWPINP